MSMSSSVGRVGHRLRSSAGHGASRVRTPAFYLLTAGFVAFLLFALREAMAMTGTAWGAAYAFPDHRVHHVVIGATLTAFVASVAVQLYRPTRRVGAMQLAIVFVVAAFSLTAAASGIVAASELLVFAVPVLVIALLHPARAALIPSLESLDRPLFAVAGIGALGLGTLATIEYTNHVTLADAHVAMGHYEFMLFGLVSIAGFALLSAFRPAGWRWLVYAAAALATLFVAVSIAFPGAEQGSSLGTIPAIAMLVWAVGLVGMAEYRVRGGAASADATGDGVEPVTDDDADEEVGHDPDRSGVVGESVDASESRH